MKKLLIAFIGLTVFLSACEKEDTTIELPTSYNFENVSISGQTARINMLSEIAAELSKGKITNTFLHSLINMYSNTGNEFTDAALNTSGKQLRDKTFATDIAFFESMFQAAADNSTAFNICNSWKRHSRCGYFNI
jgi:hypothetical protein